MNRFLIFLLLLLSTSLSAQQYSIVRIQGDHESIHKLQAQGVCIDHGFSKSGAFYEGHFSSRDVEIIQSSGVKHKVLYEDAKDFYLQRKMDDSKSAQENCTPVGLKYDTPVNFSTGTMAGFYTYDEMLAHLDNMASLYPELVSVKSPIGGFSTHEGRPIYWLKISDNPSIEEEEPEILYTSIHHAREPQSLTQLIFYMYYLLENYSTDESIKYLVDNTEMYFIPCINPDGYVYNETTNPSGFGFWRKNRRDNGDGTFGVDLNRNYGYEWAFDDLGSSPDPGSDVYRGPEPFSEPETQAVKWFCEQHNFKIALNYHSFSNLLIYPWGFVASHLTPDSLTFEHLGNALTHENHYLPGTGDQTVGYLVNGDSDDWMYGEEGTKNSILAMTPEVGNYNDGFWPDQSRIIQLCNETVFKNLTAARSVVGFALVQETAPPQVLNTDFQAGFSIQNLSLGDTISFKVSVQPLTDNILAANGSKLFNLEFLEQTENFIELSIDPDAQPGDPVEYLLEVDNDLYVMSKRVSKSLGIIDHFAETVVVDFDLLEDNSTDWSLTDADFRSPPTSVTDSPFGNYGSAGFNRLRLTEVFDLTDAFYAELRFWAKWELEQLYDYVDVRVVTGNGETVLCGAYSSFNNYNTEVGSPLYSGKQDEWVHEKISLDDFVGQQIQIAFTLVSDDFVEFDGFYLDDVEVMIYRDEAAATSIKATETTQKLELVPNPSSSFVEIKWTNGERSDSELWISNLEGKLVQKVFLPEHQNSYRLDLTTYNKGVYFIQLRRDGLMSKAEKLVVAE